MGVRLDGSVIDMGGGGMGDVGSGVEFGEPVEELRGLELRSDRFSLLRRFVL